MPELSRAEIAAAVRLIVILKVKKKDRDNAMREFLAQSYPSDPVAAAKVFGDLTSYAGWEAE